jgi:glutathione-regulated potassium-efflux system ancillary protein KefG
MKHKILILFAHPALQKSRIHRALTQIAGSMEGVTLNDLYDRYPDYFIDIGYEQQLLLDHDLIIWQYPFYWYNCPSLLKEWMDLVLEHNFAYGRNGKALNGKKVMVALSTGGGAGVYHETGSNHYTIRQFLAPFHQSALLCGMEFLPPYVIHSSHLLKENDIQQTGIQYKELLTGLRDGTLLNDKLNQVTYINEMI